MPPALSSVFPSSSLLPLLHVYSLFCTNMEEGALTTEGSVARSLPVYRDLSAGSHVPWTYIYIFYFPWEREGCCRALLKESSATLSRACTLYRALSSRRGI